CILLIPTQYLLKQISNMAYTLPTESGYYGDFGGKFVPEILIPAVEKLDESFREAWEDEQFHSKLRALLNEYVGRPTKLTLADRLSEYYGKARIYLKREDLCHTGAHKINNALDRYYWPSEWVRSVSLQKRAQVSTEWPQPPFVLNLGSIASFIWV